MRAHAAEQIQREKALLALHETARDVAALRDVALVIQAIVRRARELLGTDTAYLTSYDPKKGDFWIRSTVGTVSEPFDQIRTASGTGLCGRIAREKRACTSSDYMNDDRFRHESRMDAGVLAECIIALLGVPLIVGEEVIGVLFVADRYVRTYTPQEIALLSSLGAHAALAIENARLFEEMQSSLAREREAQDRLQAESAETRAGSDMQDQLTALIAGGGSLHDLASLLAERVDGRITIVDEAFEPVCKAASAAMSEQEEPGPGPISNAALQDAVRRSHELGRAIQLAEPRPHVVVAIGPSTLHGGLLCETDRPLATRRMRTLERGAMVAALALLSSERATTAKHRAMTDLLTAIVKGSSEESEQLALTATRYGITSWAEVALIAAEAPTLSGAHAIERLREALGSSPGIVGAYGGDLLMLVGDHPQQIAERIHRALNRDGSHTGVVVSDPVGDLTGVPAVYASVRRCLALMKLLGRQGTVVAQSSLSPYALLFSDSARHELNAYIDEHIGALLEQDHTRHSELVRTLLSYLDNGRDTSAAAAALHVHPNTLRQRLGSATQLLPHWRDRDRALDVHLALRLRSLQEKIATHL